MKFNHFIFLLMRIIEKAFHLPEIRAENDINHQRALIKLQQFKRELE